jgi:hypothetical protein
MHRAAARRDLLAVALGAGVALFVSGLVQCYFWTTETCALWLLLVTPALALGARSAGEEATSSSAPAPQVVSITPGATDDGNAG